MKQKYPLNGRDYELPGQRKPGERRIIIGRLHIDYSVFRKTPEEKLKLKIAKQKMTNEF